MDFLKLKNRRVIGVKKIIFIFQASCSLSCHFLLLFKLFSLLVHSFENVCSKK